MIELSTQAIIVCSCEIGPAFATVGRLVVVLAILAPFTLRTLRKKFSGLSKRDWVVLAAPLGERIRLAQWIGVLISFSGIATIATQGNVHRVSFNIGDLMALTSMLMWAGYTVLLRVRRDRLDIAELGAARAGATLHLMPAMGIGLSALFLGELPSWYHFAGIGLILTGTWVASSR